MPVINRHCCERCAPRAVVFCCDICHPDHFIFPIVEASDKPPKAIRKLMPKTYERGSAEKNLHSALQQLRRELAAEILPEGSFLTPQSLMSNKLLDRIVDLAHDQALKTTQHLREQITWGFLDTHAVQVLELAHKFCPPAKPAALFTNAPLQRTSHVDASVNVAKSDHVNVADVSTKDSKKRRCRKCQVPGHYGKLSNSLSLCQVLLLSQKKLALSLRPLTPQTRRIKHRHQTGSQICIYHF